MRILAAGLLTLFLSACQGAPAPMVVREQLTLAGPENGVVRVSGRPGAIVGGRVTNLILAVRRDLPTPAGQYSLLHFGAGSLITTAYAIVGPDGSLPETWVGRPDAPVRPDDELEFVLTSGTTPIGFALTMPLAWRP